MSVEVGAKAPDFTLPNQDREAGDTQRATQGRSGRPGVLSGGIQRHLPERDVHVPRFGQLD